MAEENGQVKFNRGGLLPMDSDTVAYYCRKASASMENLGCDALDVRISSTAPHVVSVKIQITAADFRRVNDWMGYPVEIEEYADRREMWIVADTVRIFAVEDL